MRGFSQNQVDNSIYSQQVIKGQVRISEVFLWRLLLVCCDSYHISLPASYLNVSETDLQWNYSEYLRCVSCS